jgi:hypothetical protein
VKKMRREDISNIIRRTKISGTLLEDLSTFHNVDSDIHSLIRKSIHYCLSMATILILVSNFVG